MQFQCGSNEPAVDNLVEIGLSQAQAERVHKDSHGDMEVAMAVACSIIEAGLVEQNPKLEVPVEPTVLKKEAPCRKRSWSLCQVCILLLIGLCSVIAIVAAVSAVSSALSSGRDGRTSSVLPAAPARPTATTTTHSVEPTTTTTMFGVVTSSLRAEATAGSNSLPATTQKGFSVGQQIIIDEGTPQEETNEIVGFGSILLKYPLKFSHSTGAQIKTTVKTTITATSRSQGTKTTTSAPAATTTMTATVTTTSQTVDTTTATTTMIAATTEAKTTVTTRLAPATTVAAPLPPTPAVTAAPPTLAPTSPPSSATAAPPTPHYLMTCSGDAVLTTVSMTCDKYDAVSASVVGLLQGLPSQCTADSCPQADWAGCVLRMAGHDFMDFHDGTGGADACTDMSDPDNAGLAACLHNGEHGVSLASAYQEYCTEVSLADFIVVAAEAVMTSTRNNVLAADPAAAPVNFRSQFRFGRTTATSCDFASGRLPNPENGCGDVQKVFVDSLGLDWSGATALMGVHTLGRARVENSGYDGWWSDAENSRRFNNNYFVVMYAKGWTAERNVNGNRNKNQWTRSDNGATHQQNPASKEMMLDTDLCLAFDENGRDLDAQTDRCCAWAGANGLGDIIQNNDGQYCGSSQIPRQFGAQRNNCCGRNRNDCGDARNPSGRSGGAARRFAESEADWLIAFHTAWKKVTENGFASLKALQGTCGA